MDRYENRDFCLVEWLVPKGSMGMGALACGRVETYADDVERMRAKAPDLSAEIAGFTGVGQVVDWLAARNQVQPSLALIGMDEFEYDFLVQVEPEGVWLAFGVT